MSNLKYPYFYYKEECKIKPITFPPQHQDVHPGLEYLMCPKPIFDNPDYLGSGKLKGKVVIITGGDSGIGRAISVACAKEGAKVTIVYLYEHEDALLTKQVVEKYRGECLLIQGDLKNSNFSKIVVEKTIDKYGRIDCLINNASVQYKKTSILDISDEQLEITFKTNIFSYFYMTKAALPYLSKGSTIINTTSVTAYEGHDSLIDYSSTKGAVLTFTRSLSKSLIDKGIRVNAVSPGPVWTPLIPSSFSAEEVSEFGLNTPMKRAGQPYELAPAYIYLASDDSSYVTGQVIHVNGGTAVSS